MMLLVMQSPPPMAVTESSGGDTMIASVFMSLLFPCLATCSIFLIYLFILWCLKRRRMSCVSAKGLHVLELEKLPKLTGEGHAVMGKSTECAV
ncbi:unnamed protein product [Cochlearia groenlandica]